MSMSLIDHSTLEVVGGQRIATPSALLGRLIGVLRQWRKRSRDRAALAGMGHLALQDIQASSAAVELEQKRWFWQAPLTAVDE